MTMTREEEIDNAKEEFYKRILEEGDYYSPRDCFEAGAEWADKHPNINSLWHTPDEIPQYNKKLVTHCDEKMEWNPINHTIYYDDPEYPWDELVKIYNILHWAYATDLVPNFNEDLSQAKLLNNKITF